MFPLQKADLCLLSLLRRLHLRNCCSPSGRLRVAVWASLASTLLLAGAGVAFSQTCSVQVTNTTHPTIAPSFYVNDSGTFTITGPANGQIYVTALQNGVVADSNVNTGLTIGAGGSLPIQATETSPYLGAWAEYWSVNGVPCSPFPIQFIVASGPFVFQYNPTHPNLSPNFLVNDAVMVKISGTPNSTVASSETVDGGSPIYYNGWTPQTDSNGNWGPISGTETAAYVGWYTEVWSTGSTQLSPAPISFVVANQQPTATLQNLTHPSNGNALMVGDQYTITIPNAIPNIPVNMTLNGTNANYGNANSSGVFTYTNTATTTGYYSEQWYTFSMPTVSPVIFTVSAPTTTKDYIYLNGKAIAIENHN